MSGTFNGYHVWLGIPTNEQPPNHYRLLGISIFETDLDVIEHAADRQMAHVRTFQSGRNGALSQQILNELAAAQLCLLNAQRKAAYDEELRAKLAATSVVNPAPTASPAPTARPALTVSPVPVAKAMPIGKAMPQGQSLPVAQAVSPTSVSPTAARPKPSTPVAPKPQIPVVKKSAPMGVDELALDLGQPMFPSAPVGMPIRVKRRKYNNNAGWQGAAIVGTLLGVVVIGGYLLYSFLGSFLTWSTVEQIWSGPGLPPVSESTAAPDYSTAPAAPLPPAPLPPTGQP